ncbi:MAG: hypothetical protein HKP61_11090, partial [Dactylosporangium sp.]|nr:hypothetical protein [Dactylosporangium sp.]NNJ61471.1 hypothetical protein [Dactylosporangium sp.]
RQLRRIGPPPYTGRGRLVRYALLARNVAKVLGEDLGLPRLARRTGPRPPELTRLDTVRGWLGRLRTLQLIYPRLQRLDLIAQSTRLGVPVHLVVDGEQASTTKLVERYLAVLDAPSKHLVRFDGSPVDPPYLGRDGAFGQWLVSTVLPGERRSPTAQQP